MNAERIAEFDRIFSPRTVAVIGASHSDGFSQALMGTRLRDGLFLVNPKYQELHGSRCYASILDVEDRVDYIIIAVPALRVPQVLVECVEKGISLFELATGHKPFKAKFTVAALSDGEHQATSVAEFLAELGKSVHILTTAYYAGADLGPTQDITLFRQRAAKLGITVTTDFHVIEIKGTEVHGIDVYSNESRVFSGYDAIVTAMGNQVQAGLYFDLKDRVREIYRIGDCVSPRKIDMAIHEGCMVGRQV